MPNGIMALIQDARQAVHDELASDTATAVAQHVSIFNSKHINRSRANPLNVFVYHVVVPPEATKISYADVRMDQSEFDYSRLIEHFIHAALGFESDCNIYLATDREFGARFGHERVSQIYLDVDRTAPMYERVRAMAAYVQSHAFDADTVFLDGDAFLNRSVLPVFQAGFDIGVTYRTSPGLMPINEGVLFASASRRDRVQSFFRAYLATYDALIEHPSVVQAYGNIRRWRGGQLSLNALASPAGRPAESDYSDIFGATVHSLPCTTYNFSIEPGKQYTLEELEQKYVIHLKGGRKSLLEGVVEYQLPRLQSLGTRLPRFGQATSRSSEGNDRRYSLDTTDPIDYEPEFKIDYETSSLTEIADHHKTDKGRIKHNYTPVYERYLQDFRNSGPIKLLEIGVACGSSLKMWSAYFPSASVVGVDIREACLNLCKQYPQIEIRIADASKTRQPEMFDIIIDDGSHISADIVDMFLMNWPSLKPGGYYFVEDLKCTHNDGYRSAFPFKTDPARFDRSHFMSFLDARLREMDWRKSDIEFIHFYKEMAVFRKAPAV